MRVHEPHLVPEFRSRHSSDLSTVAFKLCTLIIILLDC
jgi:hypothetical protein